jgi:hypothetical protein
MLLFLLCIFILLILIYSYNSKSTYINKKGGLLFDNKNTDGDINWGGDDDSNWDDSNWIKNKYHSNELIASSSKSTDDIEKGINILTSYKLSNSGSKYINNSEYVNNSGHISNSGYNGVSDFEYDGGLELSETEKIKKFIFSNRVTKFVTKKGNKKYSLTGLLNLLDIGNLPQGTIFTTTKNKYVYI